MSDETLTAGEQAVFDALHEPERSAAVAALDSWLSGEGVALDAVITLACAAIGLVEPDYDPDDVASLAAMADWRSRRISLCQLAGAMAAIPEPQPMRMLVRMSELA